MKKNPWTYLQSTLDVFFCGSVMVILAFLVVWVFADVLARFLFNHPLSGTEEIVSTSMIIVVILPIGYLQRRKQHIVVEFVLDAMSPNKGRISAFITSLMACIAWGIVGYAVLLEVWDLLRFSEVTFGPLGLKLWPFYGCAFLGVVSLVVELLLEFIGFFRAAEWSGRL